MGWEELIDALDELETEKQSALQQRWQSMTVLFILCLKVLDRAIKIR